MQGLKTTAILPDVSKTLAEVDSVVKAILLGGAGRKKSKAQQIKNRVCAIVPAPYVLAQWHNLIHPPNPPGWASYSCFKSAPGVI
jgi:hypothetical protein